MRILIVNGPNLNMLGIREPELYGGQTYSDLEQAIEGWAQELGITAVCIQSNCEGELVTAIQQAYGCYDGIVINAAAYTHTSVALLDALKAVGLPAVEVHLTNVDQREEFRHVSYVGMACLCRYIGLGFEGYHRAMEWLKQRFEQLPEPK